MNFFKLRFLFVASASLSLLCVSASAAAPKTTDQLIFAIDVIRHGDRNPILEIPKAPHTWAEGLQQLTPLGMRQEYELGKQMRQCYVFHQKLLPKAYQSGTVYVCSTNVDRTLMSAQSFLMGLYPPGTGPLIAFPFQPALPHRFQPIPIHTLPEKKDALLRVPHPLVKKLAEQYIFSTTPWQKKLAEVKPHLAAWSKATGLSLKSLDDLEFLGDTLFIDQVKHVPLPKGLSQKEAATIIATAHWEFVTMLQNPEVGKAVGGPLLRDITHYLKQAAQETSKEKTALKYVLYSGHDGTILALMSALGAPLNEAPRYASDVNIALFARPNGEKYVQVTMNGKAVLLAGNKTANLSLGQFLALAEQSQ